MKLPHLLLTCIFLCFCSCRTSLDAPFFSKWEVNSFPIEIKISSDLTECQKAGIFAVVTWYNYLFCRDVFKASVVVDSNVSVNGLPPYGTIGISRGNIDRPWHEAVSYVQSIKGRIVSADIRLSGCSVRVIAHELGHALGFDDSDLPGELMFHLVSDGWFLKESYYSSCPLTAP